MTDNKAHLAESFKVSPDENGLVVLDLLIVTAAEMQASDDVEEHNSTPPCGRRCRLGRTGNSAVLPCTRS